jgi:hypothetical protein
VSANDHSASCPASALLPQGNSDSSDSGALVEAARRRLADGTVDQDTIGRILVHVLEHPWANRPLLAQAIRDLAPWAAREAARLIRGWIDDPARSPECAAGQGRGRGPDDMLEDAIALAILDPEARAEASRRYRAANAHRAFEVHEWYARISPDHRAEAAGRLADEGLARPGGVVVPAMVVARVNALIDLGPDQLPRVRELLDKIFTDGATSGAIRRPLSAVGPVYLQEAVIAALRSLTLDPERYLPDRAGNREFRGADQLVAELAALPGYRDQLVTALENIAAHRRASTEVRWRAAALLADLDREANERASTRLASRGVADHEAPVAANPAAGRVDAAWQRIEDYFAAHDPARRDELGPPPTPEEAARCQRVLGLTDEFTASLARHRYVYVHDRDLFYDDIPRTLESCRRGDGGYDVGDMAELGADDWESTYLSRLTAYADDLEAGQLQM